MLRSMPTNKVQRQNGACQHLTVRTPTELSSFQDGIYALGKAHMRSTKFLRSFPNDAFETVPIFAWLKMAFTCPFKKDLRALVLCKPKASFLQSHGEERRTKINRHMEEKGVQRSRAWLSRLKGREKDVVYQTNTRTVSTATPGTLLRDCR